MAEILEIAYEKARNFRDKYGLGNHCGIQLLEVLNLLEKDERINIELIRMPFENLNLAGFIGYKHDTFVIVTNTNQTLGYERFTIAHEIFHLLQNRLYIKENLLIEEVIDDKIDDTDDIIEIMADSFAAELLIPEKSLIENVKDLTSCDSNIIDNNLVIQLQHTYGVDYIAMTKRLKEVNIINDQQKNELEQIIGVDGKLEELTKRLGRDNNLNTPTKDNYMLQKNLEVIKSNFENGETSYDDLIRIFGYLGCTPEKFGYEDKVELTEEAKDFVKNLQN